MSNTDNLKVCPKCSTTDCIKVGLNDHGKWGVYSPCWTRQEALPPLEGWEYYETGKAIAEMYPDAEWSKEFNLRVGK